MLLLLLFLVIFSSEMVVFSVLESVDDVNDVVRWHSTVFIYVNFVLVQQVEGLPSSVTKWRRLPVARSVGRSSVVVDACCDSQGVNAE